MSGQYPGGYNSPLGGHRGQFNPQQQQQQQMMNPMSQMGAGVGMTQNLMAGAGQAGGIMPMSGGYHPQGGMLPQQQITGNIGMSGGVGGVMNPGMQSPSHAQLQMHQQQQQQQQMNTGAGSSQQMGGSGMVGAGLNATGVVSNMNLMQQQQQQMGSSTSQAQVPSQIVAGSMQQQQQQQSNTQQSQSSNSMLTTSQSNPTKEINIVALSRLGQETVQDITSRFQEIFAALKIIQPTANRDNNTEKKVQEYFRTIRLLFKRVRIIYEKCNDGFPQGMEYTHVESLIPYKDDSEHRIEPTLCDEYRKALQENQELIETVKLKNRQLREIIDRTRIIIWEINTMLSMRRS